MVRIDILERGDKTITIEFVGYIKKREFKVLRDCLEEYAEEGITEVCIVSNEVREFSPWLRKDVIALEELGLTLRFQQPRFALRHSLKVWGLEAWIDDENEN